jgi:hypothetical protein
VIGKILGTCYLLLNPETQNIFALIFRSANFHRVTWLSSKTHRHSARDPQKFEYPTIEPFKVLATHSLLTRLVDYIPQKESIL